MRQITAERQALDKSLTAMEKENMELYRNCSQLQSQVSFFITIMKTEEKCFQNVYKLILFAGSIEHSLICAQ